MSDTLRTIFALPSLQEFIVICGMLLATYSTRLIGWLVLRRHPVSPRMQRIHITSDIRWNLAFTG